MNIRLISHTHILRNSICIQDSFVRSINMQIWWSACVFYHGASHMRNNSGTLPEWRGQTMFMYDYIKLIFFTAVFTLCFCNWKMTFMQKCQSVGEGNRRAFLCVIIPSEAQGVHFNLCLYYVNCHQWKWKAYKTNTDHSRLLYNCFRTCPLLIFLSAKFSKQQ